MTIVMFTSVVFCFGFLSLLSAAQVAEAYKIGSLNVSGALYQDFVVGPGKVEIKLAPGGSVTANLQVTNRMGDTRQFKVEVEDFTGSRDPEQTVVLLGDERGPYSLKDFLSFSEPVFELKNGERATIPVTISLPTDVEPGGHFGSVLVSTVSNTATSQNVASAVISRIGTLFFVEVPGAVKQDGRLYSFGTQSNKKFFGSGPIDFRLLYENNGSVHLNPYGEIKIANMIGETVGSVEVEPWFAMPDSLRLREVSWDRPYLFGRYTATASINRGYGDDGGIIDTLSFSFWVIPWKIVLAVFGICVVVIFGLRFIFTRFELKRKR